MKLLIPGLLLVAAIAAVAWVLAPSSTPDVVPGVRKAAAPAGRQPDTAAVPEAAEAPAQRAGSGEPASPTGTAKGAEALAAARAEVMRVRALEGETDGQGAFPTAAIEPDEVPAANAGPSKWGRQGREAQQANPKQVKDAIRAYYANLPKSGGIPAAVRLEEILPLAVIDEMNLPPGGRVIELGPHPIGDRRAFENVLLQPDGSTGALGVTVITPDGERVREYLFYPNPGAEQANP